ncbi:hypothetical protein N752_23190 [Desulforamulus aquiferis]|nr:hypothetical protein [Desulforamulus aquiferis]RYD02687.1 hypothetical protein N752_23190 [Desulforamulus aquiferis]
MTEAAALKTSDKVIVGEIISTERHPDAEKLTVCTVNVGQEEPLQIICGASNVALELRCRWPCTGQNCLVVKR